MARIPESGILAIFQQKSGNRIDSWDLIQLLSKVLR